MLRTFVLSKRIINIIKCDLHRIVRSARLGNLPIREVCFIRRS